MTTFVKFVRPAAENLGFGEDDGASESQFIAVNPAFVTSVRSSTEDPAVTLVKVEGEQKAWKVQGTFDEVFAALSIA